MSVHLEILGKFRSLRKGNVDWYYGGGNTSYVSLDEALYSIPKKVRAGKVFGVQEGDDIQEYRWNLENLEDSDIIKIDSEISLSTFPSKLYYVDPNYLMKDLGTDTFTVDQLRDSNLFLYSDYLEDGTRVFKDLQFKDIDPSYEFPEVGSKDLRKEQSSGDIYVIHKAQGTGEYKISKLIEIEGYISLKVDSLGNFNKSSIEESLVGYTSTGIKVDNVEFYDIVELSSSEGTIGGDPIPLSEIDILIN